MASILIKIGPLTGGCCSRKYLLKILKSSKRNTKVILEGERVPRIFFGGEVGNNIILWHRS